MQILGDHGRFIRDSLAPSESVEIDRARQFIRTFDGLLEQSRSEHDATGLIAIVRDAIGHVRSLRSFKLHLLRRHLTRELHSTLPPTFYNHMVNELEECLRVLSALSVGEQPKPGHSVHQHLLWLPDASGHAASLRSAVDLSERQIQARCDQFTEAFDQFHLKAIELAGYLRANIDDFPALRQFDETVSLEICLFHGFLAELEEMELSNRLLGSVAALMPDHMAREECYYLWKLRETSSAKEISLPGGMAAHDDTAVDLTGTPTACDPTHPRVRDPRPRT
ncbi:MAG: DUF2935 domain-containing protein [Alicyclobacillus sp.]|nr:DUF2935 domain-containing protein [Alicyclobacillus sp.]